MEVLLCGELSFEFDNFLKRMDPEAERQRIMQEYLVMHNKHAKEEEAVRKRRDRNIQDASIFVTSARKSSRLKTNSSPSSQSDK